MLDYSTYEPSASTIPPWPKNVENVTNVYKNCVNMTKAFASDPEELMPIEIENHSGAVLGTGSSLASQFDVDWGGTSNIFYDVAFYRADKVIFAPSGDWDNPQRVLAGSDAVSTPAEFIKDFDSAYPEDLYTYGWSGKWQNVQSDANVYRTYTHKTHTICFYDMYASTTTPMDGYPKVVDRGEYPSKLVIPPNIPVRTDRHVVYTGWTLSGGDTPDTSGDVLPDSFWEKATQDYTAYMHYYIDTSMTVTFAYYKNDEYVESSVSVEYGRTTTPPSIDSRTGYTFSGWFNGTNEVTDFSTYEIVSDVMFTAHYTKIPYTIYFIGGYDGLSVGTRTVEYLNSLSESEFPERLGTTYPQIAYVGWDTSDRTKFENVTADAEIHSIYRECSVDSALIPTYSEYGEIHGHITDGSVKSVHVDIPESSAKYYSIDDYMNIGSAFMFNLIKTDAASSCTFNDTLTANVIDEKDLSYTVEFNVEINTNKMDVYLNNNSWDKNIIRTGTGELSSTNVDSLGQPAPYQPNPDRTKYLGVMESCSNWHKGNSWSCMTVVFSGYDEMTFYLRNCGENLSEYGGDYPAISKLNERFTEKPSPTDSNVYRYLETTTTTGENEIGHYTPITYEDLDRTQKYVVDVAYVKDGSFDENADRAYFLFDCPSNEIDMIEKNVTFHMEMYTE